MFQGSSLKWGGHFLLWIPDGHRMAGYGGCNWLKIRRGLIKLGAGEHHDCIKDKISHR